MQAIMETLFDAAYLVTVVTLGCIMVKSAQDRETKLFGWMAVILGCGDAFHLVPRAWALCTDGLAAHAAALGAGKFITSITMTIFYVILYHIGKRRYGLHIRALTGAVYALAAARIGLCLFPQNAWLSANPPLSWASGATFRSHCWARWSSWYSCAARGRRGTGPSAGCGWPSCSASRSISRWCCGPTSFRSWACS